MTIVLEHECKGLTEQHRSITSTIHDMATVKTCQDKDFCKVKTENLFLFHCIIIIGDKKTVFNCFHRH